MAIRFLDCELDSEARILVCRGAPAHLTPKALELLLLLVAERPRAIPKSELLDRIWPGTFVTDASLARTVHEIREAIQDASAIRTVHGHGYAFAAVTEQIDPAPGNQTSASHATAAWIVLEGRAVPLPDGASTIGRDPAVRVPLISPQVSWHHARLDVSAAGTRIEDLGSKNGTMVSGVRISAPTVIQDGDKITIGGTRLVFRTETRGTRTKTSEPT
jgi:DNA-binding winged helix-turn-helix (wHTH) protein